jgi:hypothetical protein
MNRRFEEMYHLHLQRRKSAEQETILQYMSRNNTLTAWRYIPEIGNIEFDTVLLHNSLPYMRSSSGT